MKPLGLNLAYGQARGQAGLTLTDWQDWLTGSPPYTISIALGHLLRVPPVSASDVAVVVSAANFRARVQEPFSYGDLPSSAKHTFGGCDSATASQPL